MNYHVAYLVLFFMLPVQGFALEEMLEGELSDLVASDGVSFGIKLPVNGWRANEISLTDTNGIGAAVVAGYASAGTIVAKNVGFNTCFEKVSGGSCTSLTPSRPLPTISFDIDMVGDSNGR